jgi:hypothetical protein
MVTLRPRPRRSIRVLLALASLLVACGGDDSSDRSQAVVPTPTPASFAEALLAHLAGGLDDPALAPELVTRLGGQTVGALETAVGGDVNDPLLALAPPRVAAEAVDSLVVFAFGNRIDGDGNIRPGPTNEALAETVAAFVAVHPVPVYAQWEIGDLLLEQGVPGITSIGVVVGEDGEVIYLSTAGVAAQAVELAERDDIDLGEVGVVAFADHAVRSVLTARAAGMNAAVPEGLDLPSTYDPQSGQPWTRDRLSYLSVDLPARLLFAR